MVVSNLQCSACLLYTSSLDSMIAKEVWVPAVTQFFLAFAYCLINSFLYIFAEAQGVVGGNIGLFFTIYAMTLLFTRPLVGRLTDKLGTVKVLVPAMCFFGLSFFIISCSDTLWMFYLAAVISAFGYGACTPALQALCMKMVTPDRRGAASCTNYLGTDFGFLLGPIVAVSYTHLQPVPRTFYSGYRQFCGWKYA